MKQKIIQITAGRGPEECSYVVAQVLKIMIGELKSQSIIYEVLSRIPSGENGTLQSATLLLKGDQIEGFLANWLGTILWKGQSTFRKNHKRKNWYIGIFELEKETLSDIKNSDIHYQSMRSQGPGGQHVNKVNSAVRATHRPTGISAVSMDGRSQHQNKKTAYQRLLEKFYSEQIYQLKKEIKDAWNNHLNLQRGNPIRTIKGSDFKRKKEDKTYKNRRGKLKEDLRDMI